MELRIRGGGGNQLALYNRGRGLPRTNPASALTARPREIVCYKKIVLASLANYTLSKLFFRGEVGGGGRRVRVGGHHRFPSEMTSDKRALRFHTDDA